MSSLHIVLVQILNLLGQVDMVVCPLRARITLLHPLRQSQPYYTLQCPADISSQKMFWGDHASKTNVLIG